MVDDAAAPIDPPAAHTSITVRFRPQNTRIAGQTTWLDLVGKGEIQFDADTIVLKGRRSRFFRIGAATTISLQRRQVVDVVQIGRLLRFAFIATDQAVVGVQLQFDDEKTAHGIAARLPDTVTEAGARCIAEAKDFESRLQAVGATAKVTPALVAVNVLVFVFLSFKGAGVFEPDGQVAVEWGSNFGPKTLDGQWWRLLTSTFMHFGILHLALNMFALYQTGCLVEKMYGSAYFLVLYLFAGLAGSVASVLWHPTINSAGASGAIFGVFGGLLVFMLDQRNGVPMSIMAATRNSTLAFIGFNLLNGVAHAGIDNAAHLGGLAGGALMGLLLARPLEPARRQNPLPRLAAVMAAGTIALGCAFHGLRPTSGPVAEELKFHQALSGFAPREAKALGDYDEIMRKVQAGALQNEAAARQIDASILPQWDGMYESFAAVRLEEASKVLDFQYGLERYCDLRRKHLRLASAALRTGDLAAWHAASEALGQVNEQVKIIQGLGKAR